MCCVSCTLHLHNLLQTGGMNLARWGSLPEVLVFVIIGVAFVAMSVIIIVDKISQVRLIIYSVVVWVLLVTLMWF